MQADSATETWRIQKVRPLSRFRPPWHEEERSGQWTTSQRISSRGVDVDLARLRFFGDGGGNRQQAILDLRFDSVGVDFLRETDTAEERTRLELAGMHFTFFLSVFVSPLTRSSSGVTSIFRSLGSTPATAT